MPTTFRVQEFRRDTSVSQTESCIYVRTERKYSEATGYSSVSISEGEKGSAGWLSRPYQLWQRFAYQKGTLEFLVTLTLERMNHQPTADSNFPWGRENVLEDIQSLSMYVHLIPHTLCTNTHGTITLHRHLTVYQNSKIYDRQH